MKKRTILIADDDPGYLTPLRYYFEDRGWTVIPATDSEEIKRDARRADVLLVDVKLSSAGHEGITAIAALRADKQPRLTAPVVFFSVLAADECVAELKPLRGRFSWLRKPSALAAVEATVKAALDSTGTIGRRLRRDRVTSGE